LFAILDGDVDLAPAVNFGISFYERLLGHTDSQLADGNLPRSEVEAGLAELRARVLRTH
jgi:hypothetical protein